MEAKERLYITADKKRLVAEGDPAGAFLYAAPGDTIPQSAVAMFGLVEGAIPGEKRRDGGEDKSRKDGSDKGGKGDGNKNSTAQPVDLTEIKGIGKASAAALVAAGIDGWEKLAAIDPENPPKIDGLGARVAWADWVAAARQKAAPETPAAGGLTINELSKDD